MGRSRRNAWVWTVLAALAAVTALGPAGSAAENPPKIGVLDMQKILSDAPRVKQYMEDYDKMRQQLDQNLEIRILNLMLDDSQVTELIELKQKGAAATDKDKARIAELEKIERDRDAEFKKLQSTQQPNDTEKARLKELQDMEAKAKTTGKALEEDYISRLQTKRKELSDKADADVQEAVNKVVEAKGLTLVLVKDAVKFGGTDITDLVIDKLERKVQ